MAEDMSVKAHIDRLIDEEHRLRSEENDFVAGHAEQTRLKQIEAELDQCWDLLRQRRAKREFGESPDDAQVRPAGVVEDYKGDRVAGSGRLRRP